VRGRADRQMVNTAPPMKLPSITVVTPCLNAAATIEETLASVADQDYPRLQHLVMDGGSTDGTVALAEAFEGVEVVSEPDGGRVEAANRGAERAGGEVIAWLNADDTYEPGALQAVGSALAERPDAQWVTGYCRIVDGHGSEIREGVTAYKNLLLRHWSYPLHLTQNFVSDPATFIRAGALRRAGPLNPRWPTAHDYDLWLRAGRLGPPLVLHRYLSGFRMTEGTLSMEGFEGQFREHAEVARENAHGHRVAPAVNRLTSAAIVGAYRVLRRRRTRSARP
jgi:glycosyltransferase involved in cell wall biosynthesis